MRASFVVGIVFLVGSVACGGSNANAPAASASDKDGPAPPPSVLSADGQLYCSISSKENGSQRLVLSRGQGLEFDVAVSPIVDGVVQAKGPEKGGSYRFTSHLAKPGKGSITGVGPITIEELETKVNVEMKRYTQEGGPGTELHFTAGEMSSRGIYIEFSGRAKTDAGDKYAFKVTFGAPAGASGGTVKPTTDAENSHIHSKMVRIEAPQTTVVTTTLRKLP